MPSEEEERKKAAAKKRLLELEQKKKEAIGREDFDEAKRIKTQIENLQKKQKEDNKEEPTEEDLKKYGPAGYKPGTFVEIFGLESGEGKKLNGQKGRVTSYIYEKIRYEVALPASTKKVSIRPVNLKECEKLDKKWTYGNTCRVVCVRDAEDEALRDSNGCIGTLTSRSKTGSWKVIANGKIHPIVDFENLVVCTVHDEFMKLSWWSQALQALAIVIGVHLLLGCIILAIKMALPGMYNIERDDSMDQGEDGLVGQIFNPTVPSTYVAGLSAATMAWTSIVLWGTIICCCRMHRCLWDPLATFPKLSELSLGRKSAKTVFRLGYAMTAGLLFASVALEKELVLPHLPNFGTGKDDACFWGIVAAGAVAVLAAVPVDVGYSWQWLLHRFTGAVIVWAMWKHNSATRSLYLPGVPTASHVWWQMLKEYIPDRELLGDGEEDWAKNERLKTAVEFAAASKFLHHPWVEISTVIRYHVLSYWPMTVLMLPVFSSIVERVPENSKASAPNLLRNMLAWLQWLLLLVCTLMHLSHIPDLVAASLLPFPERQSEDQIG